MKKKFLALIILFTLVVLPAIATDKSDASIGVGIQMITVGDKFGIGRISLEESETTYFEKEGQKWAPLFKFNAGVSMNIKDDEMPMLGLSLSAVCGYSYKINDLLRVDLGGGVDFFESSVLVWMFNSLSKDSEYKISTTLAPIVDISVLFGLEGLALRAGIRGCFQISSAPLGKGIGFLPYLAVSADLF